MYLFIFMMKSTTKNHCLSNAFIIQLGFQPQNPYSVTVYQITYILEKVEKFEWMGKCSFFLIIVTCMVSIIYHDGNCRAGLVYHHM